MKSMRIPKRALISSIIALSLCFVLLLGATWAWFQATVTNSGNSVTTGKYGFDVELTVLNEDDTTWNDVTNPFFTCANWAPGSSATRVLKVSNTGSTHLYWNISFEVTEETGDLCDVIDVYYKWDVTQNVDAFVESEWTRVGTMTECITDSMLTTVLNGELYAAESKNVAVAFKMQENAGELYQGTKATFNIKLHATDQPTEGWAVKDSVLVTPDAEGNLTEEAVLSATTPAENAVVSEAVVTVPAGAAVVDGTATLKLSVTEGTKPDSVTLLPGQTPIALNISLDGLAPDNDEDITVTLTIEKNLEDVVLFHNDEQIDCEYDDETGILTFKTKSFSPFTILHGKVRTYEVKFVDWDDTVLKTETVTHGQAATAPADPTREGYTFDKWDVAYDKVTSALTVKATYTVNKYTVTFEDHDGTELSKQEIEYGKGATAPADPTRDGYDFTGWDVAYNNVTSDLTVTAQYAIKTFTVTFNYGDGKTDTQTVEWGKAATAPTDLDKADTDEWDYTFDGWDKTFTEVKENLTVTAQYSQTKRTYTITFNNENGNEFATKTLEYGAVITAPDSKPTKENTAQYTYTFAGWGIADGATVTGNATYTASFNSTVNKYTVTFMNGATQLQSTEVEYGTPPAYTETTVPSKAPTAEFSYAFAGWSTTADGKKLDTLPEVTGNVTYYAVFEATTVKYTIIFKNEDGTELQKSDVAYGATPEYEGTTPTKAATAQYTYEFAGWDPEIDTVTGEAIYTATYTEILRKYTITWVDGDGKTVKTEQVAYGETPEYNGETPTKTATAQYTFTFKDWGTVAAVTGDATYTAQFSETPREYTVKFENPNGDVISEKVMKYGESIVAPADPTYDAGDEYFYTFAGWDSEVAATVTGDVTYTAQYTQAKYMTHVSQDELYNGSKSFVFGNYNDWEKVATLLDRTNDILTFKGWVAVNGGFGQMGYKFDDAEFIFVEDWKTTTGEDLKQHFANAGATDGSRFQLEMDMSALAAGDHTVTIVYQAPNGYQFTLASFKLVVPVTYTVTWKNEDGTTLETDQGVAEGTTPTYDGATPTKAAEEGATYTYDFAGWTPEVSAVNGETVYTATFRKVVAYDLSLITKNESDTNANNKLNGTRFEFRGATVLNLNDIDLSKYAQIKITYGSDAGATFAGKFMAIVSDTTLPTSTTAANVLSFAAIENPAAGATTWTPDRSLILDLPADGDVYLAVSIGGHGVNIYSIQLILIDDPEGEEPAPTYTVTWQNEDGTTLEIDENVAANATPSYNGATPTKAAEEGAAYTYEFAGWTPATSAVTDNVTYTATFRKVAVYDIASHASAATHGGYPSGAKILSFSGSNMTFYLGGFDLSNYSAVEITYGCDYRATLGESGAFIALTSGNSVTTTSTEDDYIAMAAMTTNSSASWEASSRTATISLTNVTHQGDVYLAHAWIGHGVAISEIKFIVKDGVESHTITWKVDGQEDHVIYVLNGDTPAYSYGTPAKDSTVDTVYTFTGWDADVVAATADATYTAQFSESVREYTITFVDEDGTELQSGKVAYGETPEYAGTTPTKSSDADYAYVFAGWTPEISAVTGDVTYTATYTAIPHLFKGADGELPIVTGENATNYFNNSKYVFTSFDAYTAEQAATAGVPEGYEGNVWKLTGTTGETGIVLDFTSWGIKAEDIKSLTIRYYVDAECQAVRMMNSQVKASWILNLADDSNKGVVNVPKGSWAEVTVTNNFDLFGTNADGTLGKVALGFRWGSTFYVDSITFTMNGELFASTTDLPTVTDEAAANYVSSSYNCGSFDVYTADQTAEAGVEGYEGTVWKLTTLASQGTNGETGIVLDFTSWGIQVEDIVSMTIRYHVDTACTDIRLRNSQVHNGWILNTATTKGEWAEVTLSQNFEYFGANEDGTLGKVALCFRQGYTFYVDSIIFELKDAE